MHRVVGNNPSPSSAGGRPTGLRRSSCDQHHHKTSGNRFPIAGRQIFDPEHLRIYITKRLHGRRFSAGNHVAVKVCRRNADIEKQ